MKRLAKLTGCVGAMAMVRSMTAIKARAWVLARAMV